MCFSAEVDAVAGVVVGALAVDAWRHVRHPAERALAALPVVLAGHQLVESLVWSGLEGHVSTTIWRPALWIYLAIAFGVVPVLVPLAVGALEPLGGLRRIRVLVVIGIAVAVVLMFAVVRGPVEASIEGHHIAYEVNLWHGGLIVVLYVIATCGSMLMSKEHYIRWFGAANLVAAGVLAWLDNNAFISLWCLWAAVTSAAIAIHLRRAEPVGRHVLRLQLPR